MNDFGAVSYPAEYEVTSDEKTWGMLAHLSIIIAMFIGGFIPLGPLIVWLIKKDQSPFVAAHALHALAFSIGAFALMLFLVFGGFLLMCIGIGIVFFLMLPVLGLVVLLYSVLAAIRASEGKCFEYPITSSYVRQ